MDRVGREENAFPWSGEMSFSVKRGLGGYICDRKLKIDNILLICTEFEFVVRNNQSES